MKGQEITDLIYENQGIIWQICNTFYLTTEDREDLFQEIIIQLLKAYPKFQARSKFSTWLYRVALNTAISFKKKSQKSIAFKENIKSEIGKESNEFEESEIELLYKAIEQLSKIDKSII